MLFKQTPSLVKSAQRTQPPGQCVHVFSRARSPTSGDACPRAASSAGNLSEASLRRRRSHSLRHARHLRRAHPVPRRLNANEAMAHKQRYTPSPLDSDQIRDSYNTFAVIRAQNDLNAIDTSMLPATLALHHNDGFALHAQIYIARVAMGPYNAATLVLVPVASNVPSRGAASSTPAPNPCPSSLTSSRQDALRSFSTHERGRSAVQVTASGPPTTTAVNVHRHAVSPAIYRRHRLCVLCGRAQGHPHRSILNEGADISDLKSHLEVATKCNGRYTVDDDDSASTAPFSRTSRYRHRPTRHQNSPWPVANRTESEPPTLALLAILGLCVESAPSAPSWRHPSARSFVEMTVSPLLRGDSYCSRHRPHSYPALPSLALRAFAPWP
ncbi:hypothetical protein BD626DRAFT_579193 [Schizophyllum amplum]|uniref:Uncharacterized protein n=1 Tax=Schizophyllum amplum TaxID=97359 RepID=A0A550BRP5_9AGAR|nr:hypothetical protein BD626DRAFT_579193 [Auriculariopsis ampla]